MSPTTKAILKTTGVVLAGAATFAYLPLVLFAAAPQTMAWVHMTLAAFHPLLGEALLGGGCLAAVGLGLKKVWSNYFAERKLEKKVEQIVEKKLAHQQKSKEDRQKQKENVEEIEHPENKVYKEAEQKTDDSTISQNNNPVKHSGGKLRWKIFWGKRGRNNYRDAA